MSLGAPASFRRYIRARNGSAKLCEDTLPRCLSLITSDFANIYGIRARLRREIDSPVEFHDGQAAISRAPLRNIHRFG
jgi:hypothetical protein